MKKNEKSLARSDLMQVRLQPQLREAIGEAATARGMSSSEWVRQAVMTVARLEGISTTVNNLNETLLSQPEASTTTISLQTLRYWKMMLQGMVDATEKEIVRLESK